MQISYILCEGRHSVKGKRSGVEKTLLDTPRAGFMHFAYIIPMFAEEKSLP